MKLEKIRSVKFRLVVIGSLLVISALVALAVGFILRRQYVKEPAAEGYSQAAISTDAAQCAPVGKSILKKNGSVVDAAIATLLCMGVVNPQSMGLGGGFIMLIYKRNEKTAYVLNAREVAPQAATENMFQGNSELSKTGGLSIAVPGELAGYAAAWTKYGKLPWSELFQPAIDICEKGFLVGRHLSNALYLNKNIIENEKSLRIIFWNNETNNVYKENEILYRPVLAETLRTLSSDNTTTHLYGDMSKILSEEIQNSGGIITEEDFMKYKPQWQKPIQSQSYNNLTFYGVPPPGSGVLVSYMINILEEYEFNKTSFSTNDQKVQNYHRMIETFKYAYAKRTELEDQGDDTSSFQYENISKLVQKLTSKEFAKETKNNIYDNQTFDSNHYGVKAFIQADRGTSHLSIVAPNGDGIAVSSTINSYFGSKKTSISTGIIFNNEMDDFSSPNITNDYGVVPLNYNKISPGKRPFSSMSPTIVVDSNENIKLVIGGTGGTKITTATTLVTMLNLWAELSIKNAIDSPRIHHQLIPNTIVYETKFPEELLEGLNKKGHNVTEISGRSSAIMGIARGKSGKLYAEADYRKGGASDGF
ncbi:scoloptoxin SSD14-like isoform X2 [Tachypleus tridentatus]|uniref:scoloptoxin SSD14-like isoform X2 n=1 Tax=Tachypleus tridentatus TaxID=6853 RepID=UPI003FD558BB